MFAGSSAEKMNSKSTRLIGLLTLILLAHTAARAQMPTAGSPTGINAAFMKLFGDVSAFSARLDTQVLDRSGKEMLRMPMDFAALDKKIRMDINLEQSTSGDMPASSIASLKQSGMDRIVSLYRPDKKATFILYPSIKKYMTLPLAKGESEAMEKGLQIEKTALGKETIDGHPCVKHKVVIKNAQGPVLESTTWNAGDLKDLPIQIETKENDKTVMMRFKQVQFAKPDPKQFDLPADYTLMK
jgi:hypothetical protein